MGTRLDHLVIAVPDVSDAARRWTEAGLPAIDGGRHPVGTRNALVRGPGSAYVELIAAEPDAHGPWPDRVRNHPGPLSWALAVNDLDAARTALIGAGFSPGPTADGSRTTPEGMTVAWRSCDVGPAPFDSELPFLIQWTTPMPTGAPDGPSLVEVVLGVPDPARVARLLETLGLAADGPAAWRRFDDGEVAIVLGPAGAGEAPELRCVLGTPRAPAAAEVQLDGVWLLTRPDLRAHPGHVLLSAVEERFAERQPELVEWDDPHAALAPPAESPEEWYSRCTDPAKYRYVVARVRAWLDVLVAAGLADRSAIADGWLVTPRAAGALPLTVTVAGFEGVADNLVELSVAGVHLAREPDCGCDACDSGSADLRRVVNETLLHVLDGGVLQVADGRGRAVTSTLDGWSAGGDFGAEDPTKWLAEARRGASPYRVVAGAPWL